MAEPSKGAADGCAFCGIISGALPRDVRYEDDELIVFRNALRWAPVMYLVAPKEHMSQSEFWRSPSFTRAGRLAVEIAETETPGGFRLVSNFGDDAMQSQSHGHLHLLGGVHLGLYMDFPRKGDFWLRNYGYTERAPQPSQAITDAPPPATGEPRP